MFRYEEGGTVRFDVTEQYDKQRVMVNSGGNWVSEGWSHKLTFYAYDEPRPRTQYIWVAFRSDPARCIFLKGKQSDTLQGWERRLEFWVPK